MHKILLVGVFLFIAGCMSSMYKCIENGKIGGYKICEDANGISVLFFDEKYLMEDIPLLALFYLKAKQELPENNDYTIGVLAKSYKDSVFLIESDISLLQNISEIKDTFHFYAVTKYILDSFQTNDIVSQDIRLEENNKEVKYFSNPKMRFAKFLIYCFLEKENLNLEKLTENLLLNIVTNIDGEWTAKNNNIDIPESIKNRKSRDLRMTKKIFNLIKPDYDIEKFILKLKKDLKKRDSKMK